MEPAAHRTHEGPGVARRAAHHERQRAARVAEEADDDAPLAEEGAEAWVPAPEVRAALPEVGDNYHALPPAEKKAARIGRQRQERLDAQRAAEAGGADAEAAAGEEGGAEEVAALAAPEHAHRHASALAELFLDEQQAADERDAPEELAALHHGHDLSAALLYVRRRLREYLREVEGRGGRVLMRRTARGDYPSVSATISFGRWLATTRIRACHAAEWEAAVLRAAGAGGVVARTGRGSHTTHVALQHMKNHLWRELWPAMPADTKDYWRRVVKRVGALWDGGGGGMLEAAALMGRAAATAAVAAGKDAAAVEAARRAAATQAEEQLRASTTSPLARHHLYQVGEYQLQDALLSEPFEVNASVVVNAYTCLARTTGCRPGMAVNDASDMADKGSHWCARRRPGAARATRASIACRATPC